MDLLAHQSKGDYRVALRLGIDRQRSYSCLHTLPLGDIADALRSCSWLFAFGLLRSLHRLRLLGLWDHPRRQRRVVSPPPHWRSSDHRPERRDPKGTADIFWGSESSLPLGQQLERILELLV